MNISKYFQFITSRVNPKVLSYLLFQNRAQKRVVRKALILLKNMIGALLIFSLIIIFFGGIAGFLFNLYQKTESNIQGIQNFSKSLLNEYQEMQSDIWQLCQKQETLLGYIDKANDPLCPSLENYQGEAIIDDITSLISILASDQEIKSPEFWSWENTLQSEETFFTQNEVKNAMMDSQVQSILEDKNIIVQEDTTQEYLQYIFIKEEEMVSKIIFDNEQHAQIIWNREDQKNTPLFGLKSRIQSLQTQDISAFITSNFNTSSIDFYLFLGTNEDNVDTIIIAGLNHQDKKITLVSVPRDLWYKSQKINSFYKNLGIDAFLMTIENIFDIHIQGYAMVNMDIFPQIIDAIGGIEYTFEKDLKDHTYVTKDLDTGEKGTLYYPAGTYTLSGIEVLRVSRSRYTTNDFERAKRQQKVLLGIKQKLESMSKQEKVFALFPFFFEHTQTNISLTTGVSLFFKTQSYEIQTGTVMSPENILYETMIPVQSGLFAYILLPKRNDWSILPDFLSTQMQ